MSHLRCRLFFGLVPPEFEDVETAAEVRGVGESLELAECGVICLALLREQPLAADVGEPCTLILEPERLAS